MAKLVVKDRNVRSTSCPKCKEIGIRHYIKDRDGDQKYVEYIHIMIKGKRKVCYVGKHGNNHLLSYPQLFRSIYKDLGKLLIHSNDRNNKPIFPNDIQTIIEKYKPHIKRKLDTYEDKNEGIDFNEVVQHMVKGMKPK